MNDKALPSDNLKKIRIILRFILRVIYKPAVLFYLRSSHVYNYENLRLEIPAGVFHPALFFSTRAFAAYLKQRDLRNKRMLEIGAGSGLLSLLCAAKGAEVTAVDIAPKAINAIKKNGQLNGLELRVIQSDLFKNVPLTDFDLLIINPPWFPNSIDSQEQQAFNSGEDHLFFERFFHQLCQRENTIGEILMILGETANLNVIKKKAEQFGIHFNLKQTCKHPIERQYIFRLLIQ